jgi:hypothetical protein
VLANVKIGRVVVRLSDSYTKQQKLSIVKLLVVSDEKKITGFGVLPLAATCDEVDPTLAFGGAVFSCS